MKSPFVIEQDFLSAQICEDVVDSIDDSTSENIEFLIRCLLPNTYQKIQNQFNTKISELSNIQVFQHHEGYSSERFKTSDAYKFIKGNWVKYSNYDFTGIIFLSDYNDRPPFSSEFEVYGGQLDFQQHKFSFNPSRGTMIIFPTDPHFLYKFLDVHIGSNNYIKFNLTSVEEFVYNRLQYPGNYLSWFQEIG